MPITVQYDGDDSTFPFDIVKWCSFKANQYFGQHDIPFGKL